jgi:hypothetical protein
MVTASDPWDFVSSAGSNVFVADIHEGPDGDGPLLLRLAEPVHGDGHDWHWFAATRTPDGTFALYGVAESQAMADDWRDVPNTWRGQSPAAQRPDGTVGTARCVEIMRSPSTTCAFSVAAMVGGDPTARGWAAACGAIAV